MAQPQSPARRRALGPTPPTPAPSPSPEAAPRPFDAAAHARFGHRLADAAPLAVEAETVPSQAEPEAAVAPLQRRAQAGPALPPPDVPVASGGGSPLPPPVRGKMERSFGHSFADVRVHSGGEAKAVGALAYTRGENVHFQPGLYDPDGERGQTLLGHELTHVVQQRAGRVAAPAQHKGEGAAPINADAALEAEADRQGAKAARGESASVAGAGSGVQRKAEANAPIQRWGEGLWDLASGAVSGLASAVAHPITTASTVASAVAHPVTTMTSAYNYVMGGGAPANNAPVNNPVVNNPVVDNPVLNNAPINPVVNPVVNPAAGPVGPGKLDQGQVAGLQALLQGPQGNPNPVAPVNPAPDPQQLLREANVKAMTARSLASRATDKVENTGAGDTWSEVPAVGGATFDTLGLGGKPGLKGMTDKTLAEVQYDAQAKNLATAATAHKQPLGGEVTRDNAGSLVHDAAIHGADGSVIKQSQAPLHDRGVFGPMVKPADMSQPHKLDKGRKDLLRSQLIATGRAQDDSAAPLPKVKAIQPVAPSLDVGVYQAGLAQQQADIKDLGKKRGGGFDPAMREAKSQHILEHMELGVNQNKLADRIDSMSALPKGDKDGRQAAIDAALMDPLTPGKARDAAGLETQIDAHNAARVAAAAVPYEAAFQVASGGKASTDLTLTTGQKKTFGDAGRADPGYQAEMANKVFPAHFIGRHGAQTTAEDQIMRLGAGVAPDKKPAVMPADAPMTGGAGIGATSLPNYTTTGADSNATSASRFSSHAAQLYAMEEAFAQATNAPSRLKDTETLNYDVPVKKQETRGLVKYDNTPAKALQTTGPIADPNDAVERNAKAQRQNQTDWAVDAAAPKVTGNTTFNRDSERMAVTVGPQAIGGQDFGSYGITKAGSPLNTGESMGEGFNLVKPDPTQAQMTSPKLPDLRPNQPLAPADLQKRVGAVEKTAGLDGAKVILDTDTVRGGYTPQTAFPIDLDGAHGSMTQDYTSTADVLKERRVAASGAVTDVTGKAETSAPIPSIVGHAGSGLSDEQQLAASLKTIQDDGEKAVWDPITMKSKSVKF